MVGFPGLKWLSYQPKIRNPGRKPVEGLGSEYPIFYIGFQRHDRVSHGVRYVVYPIIYGPGILAPSNPWVGNDRLISEPSFQYLSWMFELVVWYTPFQTNSLHLKIGHPKRKLVFQPSIFRCYVSFREGMYFNSSELNPGLIAENPVATGR